MLENRKEFAEKLNNTVIPSSMPEDEQRKLYNELYVSADRIRPERLYRFRTCSERSFDSLEKDQFWVSRADCMNDGFDTRLFFDLKQVEEAINQMKSYSVDRETLIKDGTKLFGCFPQFVSFKEMIESLTDEQFEKTLKRLIDYYSDDALQAALLIPAITQQSIKFGCLSESIKSAAMWGLYAGDESGFALEYSFDKKPYAEPTPNGFTRVCSLFPVVYDANRFQVSTDYIIYLLQYRLISKALNSVGLQYSNPDFCNQILNSGKCPDLFIATKASLNKSKEWEQEAEWRLFVSSVDDVEFQNAKHGYCIKKPTAIYLGRRINRYNEIVLLKIAQDKSMPVFKMALDDSSPSYELVFSPVN